MSNNERFIKIHTDANIIQNENKDHVNARRKTERTIKITYIIIMYLNTQSTSSSFDEVQDILQQHPFDVVTFPETVAEKQPSTLKYLIIPVY